MPFVLNSLEDMRFLLSRLSALRQEFEAQTNDLHNARDENGGESNLCSRSGRPGPPRFYITEVQLEALHLSARFRWNDVARI